MPHLIAPSRDNIRAGRALYIIMESDIVRGYVGIARRAAEFMRQWMLIIAMLCGVAAYAAYAAFDAFDPLRPAVRAALPWVQPALIFCMLFLTFVHVSPRKLRLHRWHLWLLLIQGGLFTAIGTVLVFLPHSGLRVVLEGSMLCLICPTATAGAVVTRKLGGNVEGIVTYTVLINLLAACLVPLMVPLVHPAAGVDTLSAAAAIMGKVFPLLLLPLAAGIAVGHWLPSVREFFGRVPDLAFYLWAVALALAIAVTARSLWHSDVGLGTELSLVAVSLVCCLLQFRIGRRLGRPYGDPVTPGQSMGQKNTVLAIWMGAAFFTPVTALAGGFYSLWHNIINSYQLRKHRS